jgi:glycosyltransferase involved in cell wall biosynthesis
MKNGEHSSVTIVIPTLNEAEGIRETIRNIPFEEIRRMGYSAEIIVVDANSTDGTKELARKLGAKIIVEPKRGYGRAYKTGFLHSNGDIIVTLDGDASYPSEYIPKLIKYLIDNDLHFITTDRFTLAEHESISRVNRLGNFILSIVARILFNIRIKDSQSGMWVFRRHILKEIMPISDKMAFSEEIKIRAFLRLRKVTEVSVPYRRRNGKRKLKIFRDGIMNFLHLFNLLMMVAVLKR